MRKICSALAVLALAGIAAPASASAGSISGTVTDEITGAPVGGIRVGAGPVGFGLRDYAFTAADGTYEIPNLEAGQFNVCFLPERGVNLLRECWNNSPTAYGQAITVPATGAVDDIDAALPPGTAVSGRVVDWDGQPLAGVCVGAWTPVSGGFGRKSDATTAADGTYTMVGLDPGLAYKVVFGTTRNGYGNCDGAVDRPGFIDQWFDRVATQAEATAVTPTLSENVAGIDGMLGTSATPPGNIDAYSPRCVVPKLKGKTFATARKALTKRGCSVPKPLQRASKVRQGRVLKTRPAAGKRVKAGTRVKLVVSRPR